MLNYSMLHYITCFLESEKHRDRRHVRHARARKDLASRPSSPCPYCCWSCWRCSPSPPRLALWCAQAQSKTSQRFSESLWDFPLHRFKLVKGIFSWRKSSERESRCEHYNLSALSEPPISWSTSPFLSAPVRTPCSPPIYPAVPYSLSLSLHTYIICMYVRMYTYIYIYIYIYISAFAAYTRARHITTQPSIRLCGMV